MTPTSEQFLQEVRRDHTIVSRVELLNPNGEVLAELAVTTGRVNVTRRSRVRRRASVEAANPEFVPVNFELTEPQGLERFGMDGDILGAGPDIFGAQARTVISGALAPYGTEFRVWRGVQYADGTEELVCLGVFLAEDVNISDGPDGVVLEVSGPDRAQRVSDARWTEPHVIAAGTNYAEAIAEIITSRFPAATFDFMSTSRTTPVVLLGDQADNDPWADAQDLARNIGAELFFDADGVCVLRPEANVLTDPEVWTIAEGDNRTLLDVRRRLNRRTTYNGVIVTGESPAADVPVRAQAWDDNPFSPTYRYGPFGPKPRFYSSELITTEAQAQDVANALLHRYLGLDEGVDATIPPMPALDAGDVVRIRRQRSRIDAAFTVEGLSIPLEADQAMRVSAKRRRSGEAPEEDG